VGRPTTPAVDSTPVSEALEAIGLPASPVPRRPVLHGPGGTVLLLATFDGAGRTTYHGVWLSRGGSRWLGPVPTPSLVSTAHRLDGITGALVDLVQASARGYLERLEGLATRLDAIEGQGEHATLAELAVIHRAYRQLREHVARLTVLVAELEGPLGERFPKLPDVLPQLQAELNHLEEFCSWLGQGIRDLVALHNAAEANRLAIATNRLSETSNRIAEYANTSNIRMLAIAYVALLLGLISAVVLIPNTAATILGMPSAAWVPGLWVDVILVVLAVLPIAVVFSRPWVRHVLRTFRTTETRTAEGVADLPELGLEAPHPPNVRQTPEPPR
jgi:hypothetical protein